MDVDLGLIVSDQLAVVFFNNLEEVVKIYQLALMRVMTRWQRLVGSDCNHQV
jgi:hypothetical protein